MQDDDDLEEIESQLYCQIYHLNTDEIEPDAGNISLQEPIVDMRSKSRYFRDGNKFTRKSFNKTSNFEKSNTSWDAFKKPRNDNISINKVVVVNPYKNLVCLAVKKQKKKAKKKLKQKQKKAIACITNRVNTHIRFNDPDEDINEIIALSDSDSDCCVEISKTWSTLSIPDSEDENNVSVKTETVDKNECQSSSAIDNDDVIFVEPVVVPVEVINLDEDESVISITDSQKQYDNLLSTAQENTKPSDADSSVGSSGNPATSTPKDRNHMTSKERKELLSTPESTSNDFLDNMGVDVGQHKFNFSLHGTDFSNRELLKPAKRIEVCETESSSSTIDVNAMKTIVFNVIEFPKEDIFSEANLESFGNLITPTRKRVSQPAIKDIETTEIPRNSENTYSSASSTSESDYEPEENRSNLRSKRALPNLSPMVSQGDLTLKVMKEKKNPTIIKSKYDLVESSADSGSSRLQKRKKMRSTSQSDKGSETDGSKKNSKRKKRRSETQLCPELGEYKSSSETAIKDKEQFQQDTNNVGQNSNNYLAETEMTTAKNDCLASNTLQDVGNDEINPLDNVEKVNESNTPSEQEHRKTPVSVTVLNESGENTMININVSGDATQSVETFVVIDETTETDNEAEKSKLVPLSDSEPVCPSSSCPADVQLGNCPGTGPSKESPRKKRSGKKKSKDESFVKEGVTLVNHSLQEVQNTMPDNPELWGILESDRILSRKGPRGRRCNRCRQLGHMAVRCPNSYLPPKCRLCGHVGHYEPRCPNKICMQCGRRGNYSTTYCNSCFKFRKEKCSLCKMLGHVSDSCPDLWRRYHLTTEEGPLVNYEGPLLKPRDKLWCSGCAQSGHLEHICRYYNSPYPPSSPHIQSYYDVYADDEAETRRPQPSPQKRNEVPKECLIKTPPRMVQRQNAQFPQHPRAMNNPYNVNVYQPNFLLPPAVDPKIVNDFIAADHVNGRNNFINHLSNQNIHQTPFTNMNQTGSQFSDTVDPQAFYFADNLPNFICFDSANSTEGGLFQNHIGNVSPAYGHNNSFHQDDSLPHGRYEISWTNNDIKRQNRYIVFFKQPVIQIQNFLSSELRKLEKMSYKLQNQLKSLKKSFSYNSSTQFGPYYKTLNMMLFGVFLLNNGKLHMDKLKNVRLIHPRSTLSSARRQSIYESYCYVFGSEKHKDIDYSELLYKI